MIQQPLILGQNHYKTYMGEFGDGNANPSTHIASLAVANAGSFICKLLPPPSCGVRLGNEIIGYILGHATLTPLAPRAALLIMTIERARHILPEPIARELIWQGRVFLWCTEMVQHRSLRSLFRASDERTGATMELLRHPHGQRMTAFDHLAGNIDRHDGNYLYVSKSECIAIDHELLFGGMDWRTEPLSFETQNQLLKVAERCVMMGRDNARQILQALQSAMVLMGEQHWTQYGPVYSTIESHVARLYGAVAAQNVLSCLSERSMSGWMKHELRLI